MACFLRAVSFVWLLAFSLFATTSCKKKDETIPDVPTGTVDVTITPAGSVQYISVTPRGGTSGGLGNNPDPTGYCKIGGLVDGDYVVTYMVTSGYTAPTPQVIHITANANLPLGTVTVSPIVPTSTIVNYPLQGTMSWQSSTYYAGPAGSYSNVSVSGTLTLSGGNPSGITLVARGQSGTQVEALELYVPNYSGPALYTLNYSSGYNYANYLNTTNGVVNASLNTKLGGAAGTVTVTAHNLTARTLSGTFGYVASNSNNTARATVSNGTFSLSY